MIRRMGHRVTFSGRGQERFDARLTYEPWRDLRDTSLLASERNS